MHIAAAVGCWRMLLLTAGCCCCCWVLHSSRQQQHACWFMDAGSFMHACQLLLMRACVLRAYCKKCRVHIVLERVGRSNMPVLKPSSLSRPPVWAHFELDAQLQNLCSTDIFEFKCNLKSRYFNNLVTSEMSRFFMKTVFCESRTVEKSVTCMALI